MTISAVGGIDVGGTTVKAGVLEGERLTTVGRPRPTPHGADAVIDMVCEMADELAGAYPLTGIGVAVPGIVDDQAGVGVRSVNLGWSAVPFRDRLQERLALPVAFGHDVRCGGLAEVRLGAARGHSDAVFVPIGTGIAAALIFDGQPYGGRGVAGEIGHADVGHGERCRCGLFGCLEAVASGAAIARRFQTRTGRSVAGAREVAALAAAGDGYAARVWDDALDGLATALAWVASLLAPEVIVLGGGLAQAGDALLLHPLASRLDHRLSFHRHPALTRAALGDQAGWIGAALLAQDLMSERV